MEVRPRLCLTALPASPGPKLRPLAVGPIIPPTMPLSGPFQFTCPGRACRNRQRRNQVSCLGRILARSSIFGDEELPASPSRLNSNENSGGRTLMCLSSVSNSIGREYSDSARNMTKNPKPEYADRERGIPKRDPMAKRAQSKCGGEGQQGHDIERRERAI